MSTPINLDDLPPTPDGPPEQVAADESYWAQVRKAFVVDTDWIHFNNAGQNPMPRAVLEAMQRELERNNLNPVKAMAESSTPREAARVALAETFGCVHDEIAIMRNTSEAMQTLQFGFDLEPGDEVLTTTQDYPRFIIAFRQRERRHGIVLKRFPVSVPWEDPRPVVNLFEQHITPKTKLILMSHMVTTTGQVMPVREVVQMARKRGVPVLVDGAQSFGHIVFKQSDLDCDFFATSLHKWMSCPCGSGMLFMRKDEVADVWPLLGARPEHDANIRKFEEIGTAAFALPAAISAAVAFYRRVGPRLAANDRVRLLTSLNPERSCGVATVQIEGVDSMKLSMYLKEKHHIINLPVLLPEYQGLRISPNIYSTVDEVDRFADVMESVACNGLPG